MSRLSEAILCDYRAEMALASGDHVRLATVCRHSATLAAASASHELLFKSHIYNLLPKLSSGGDPGRSAVLVSDAFAAGYRRTFADILATPMRPAASLPPHWPPELQFLTPISRTMNADRAAAAKTVFELLTSREIDALTGVSCGDSNKKITRQLQLTPETVKWHLKNAMRKLNADSRSCAVRKAAALGLALAD